MAEPENHCEACRTVIHGDAKTCSQTQRPRRYWYFREVCWALAILLLLWFLSCALRPSFFSKCALATCRANPKTISAALATYSHDYSGEFPPDLQTLMTTERLSPLWVRCIACEAYDPNVSDYFYFPGMCTENVTKNIVVCDFGSNHDGKSRNCLFQSGYVGEVTEKEFQQLLARPEYADFARALHLAEAKRKARPSP